MIPAELLDCVSRAILETRYGAGNSPAELVPNEIDEARAAVLAVYEWLEANEPTEHQASAADWTYRDAQANGYVLGEDRMELALKSIGAERLKAAKSGG